MRIRTLIYVRQFMSIYVRMHICIYVIQYRKETALETIFKGMTEF
jgi:hypothetical protein